MTGCSHPFPLVIEKKPPEQTLTCEAVVKPAADPVTQNDYAVMMATIFYAWKDCYEKLSEVRKFIQDE